MYSRRGRYHRWTNEERRLLLEKRIELDYLFEKNPKSGSAWKKVAAEIKDNCEGKDVQRCKSQWIFLLKKYKSLKEKSAESSGRDDEVWDDKTDFELYDTIDNYMTLIKPEFQLDTEEENFPAEFSFPCQDAAALSTPSDAETTDQFEIFPDSKVGNACKRPDVPKVEAPNKKIPASCRVCLATGNDNFLDWTSNIEDLSPSLSYAHCFEQCTRLDLEPHFPQKICFECAFELRETYVFLEKAKRSDQILRSKMEQDEFAKEEEYDLSQDESVKEEEHDLSQDEPAKEEEHDFSLDEPAMEEEDDFSQDEPAKDDEYDLLQDVPTKEEEDELIDEMELIASNSQNDEQEDEISCAASAEHIPEDEDITETASMSAYSENSSPMESVEFVDLNFPEQSAQEQVAGCEFCGGQFPVKTLKKHMREAHREKNYLCHTCCYTTSNKYTFKNHLKTHDHGRTKNHSCELCGRSFFFKDKLESHMQVHDANREPRFKCDLCDKRFFYRGSLNTHKNSHAGIMIYCEQCGKSFLRRGDYKIHMLSHTGERPFKCEICGGGFTKTFTYKRHMLQHTDHRYTCEVCGAEFKHESSLRVHKVRHTGVMPLMCLICKKDFIELEKIKRHLRGVHKIYDRAKMAEVIHRKQLPEKDSALSDDEDIPSELEEEDFWSESENYQMSV